jgi:hypothetical protein
MSENTSKIIWTEIDEAPALATYSLLPIVNAFTNAAGVTVETRDISLSGRIISTFNDYLTDVQKQADELAYLGELVEKNMKMPHGDLPMGMIKAPADSGMGVSTPINDMKVEKATGQDAYTIAEVYKKKSDICNNKVIVRGKVVKVLPEILGKNWIHLQDGSGDEKKGNYDLVVTSKDLPSLGDVITVSGTLYTDKDFGAGYKYNVIVEKASITK